MVLKTDKEAIVAVDGVGGEGEGEIEAITSLDERVLDHRVEGKVLLAKDFDKVRSLKRLVWKRRGLSPKFNRHRFCRFTGKKRADAGSDGGGRKLLEN